MTGTRLTLMTGSQPELPTIRPAEERAETTGSTTSPLLTLLTCVQLLDACYRERYSVVCRLSRPGGERRLEGSRRVQHGYELAIVGRHAEQLSRPMDQDH